MSQSLSRVYIHYIFSTSERRPFLGDPEILRETHGFIGGIAKKLGADPIRVGGVADHIHALVILPRTLSIADLVKEMKRVSTNHLKEIGSGGKLNDFGWQGGYGAFSVSESKMESVSDYISRQEEHHRKVTFQDEYRKFLKRHGVEWDERYVWD